MGKVVEFAVDIEEYCQKFAEVFEDVYQEVSEFAKDKFDDASNLVDFLVEAMKAVAKHGELHGFDKKELVNDVVCKVIDDMTIPFEDKEELRHKVLPHLSGVIEMMIAAAKGHLFLKKVGDKMEDYGDDVAYSCKKCCTGCCAGCKPKPQPKSVIPRSNVAKDVPIESGAVDDLGVIIYDKLRKMITTKHVTVSNIITVVGIIMQLVQQYPTLLGAQKKQIVKNVIYRVVAEFPMAETDRLALKVFLDGALDRSIDYIIAIANGEIDLIGQVVDAVDKISESCARCC